MYKLLLTMSDISFLEWARDKYCVGDILPLIWDWRREKTNGDFIFQIPEHIAWEVRELIEEDTEDLEGIVPCAGKELSDKLILWAMEVI